MLNRLLITGASGNLGRLARARLRHVAKTLRLSDIGKMAPAEAHEEVVTCDLGDAAGVMALVEGCDGVLHLGGISVEDKFSKILNANIAGVYNLYEAARHHGHPRIIFASSNHAIGYYRQDEWLDASVPQRPDGLYGVSKCFGENIASLYHDKFGQESALVRIGSCFPEPLNHRMLSTWLSPADFVSMVECIFRAPRLGCPVIYGVSENDCCWWDNSAARYLGWRPKGNAERFRAEIDAKCERPDVDAPDAVYQGGMFTADGIHEE